MTALRDVLCNLVANKVQVSLLIRSHPELVVSGALTNFDLEHRTYTVLLKSGKLFIVNMDDVSMLEATN